MLSLRRIFLSISVLLICGALRLTAAETLAWNVEKKSVDADIQKWDLNTLLENIAVATGWEIYLEPNTTRNISSKFTKLPPNDALKLLLGDINYALLPQTNAPSKFFVFRTTVGDATQRIKKIEKSAKKKNRILNELIVVVKPGTDINALAAVLGAKVIGRAESLNAYRLQFETEAAANAARELLSANPEVVSVDSNYYMERPEPLNSLSFGSSSKGFTLKPNSDPNHIVVGLIDTAVQSLGNGMDAFVRPQVNIAGGGAATGNSPTHGTSMLATLLNGMDMTTEGSTSTLMVAPYNVYSDDGYATAFEVAKGAIAAFNDGATILSMSLGGAGESDFLRSVLTGIEEKGGLIFAAAGNEPVTTPVFPAAYPGVNAVTAVNRDGQVASYANQSSIPKLGAPGANIITFNNSQYYVSGTSVSTAFVAGMAAGLADSGKSLPTVQTMLWKNLSVK